MDDSVVSDGIFIKNICNEAWKCQPHGASDEYLGTWEAVHLKWNHGNVNTTGQWQRYGEVLTAGVTRGQACKDRAGECRNTGWGMRQADKAASDDVLPAVAPPWGTTTVVQGKRELVRSNMPWGMMSPQECVGGPC